MSSVRINSFKQLLNEARSAGRQRMAVAAAGEDAIVGAVAHAIREGLIYPILIGDAECIRVLVKQHKISMDSIEIVDIPDPVEASLAAVKRVHDGEAELVMKGLVTTKSFLRAILKQEFGLRRDQPLSHVAVIESPDQSRLMLMTDSGINIHPNFSRKIAIIQNALVVAKALGIAQPKVAVVASAEKVRLPAMPATLDAELLRRMGASGKFGDCIIDGPMSMDNVLDRHTAKIKGRTSPVTGNADVIVVPNLETGNTMYKTIRYLIHREVAGIVVGAAAPVVVTSRSDSAITKMNSISLGAIYAQRILGKTSISVPKSVPEITTTHRIVAINPGSTSTKIALFENERCVHNVETDYAIINAVSVAEQQQQIKELEQRVLQVIQDAGWETVDAIAARGGFVPRPPKKLSGGVYAIAEVQDGKLSVNEPLVTAMLEHPEKKHASNLGIPVAASLAKTLHVPAYFVDPVIVDEFIPEAEISGYKGITRINCSHALSVRAAARKAAQEMGKTVEEINLVVAHLGGGVTIAAVKNGRIIDTNIALLGGGPLTPQRAGQLPLSQLIDLCYSGRFTKAELEAELTKRGGLQSYLGDYRLDVIEDSIQQGDAYAKLIVDAMIYQIAKEIGAMYVAAGGSVDAIVLTGGMVRAQRVRNGLQQRVGSLVPVIVYEQSLEMEALASGAYQVLTGNVQAKTASKGPGKTT